MKIFYSILFSIILSAQTLVVKSVAITWEPILNAKSYSIHVDSGVGVVRVLRTDQNFQKINLTDGRDHIIFVYAHFEDGVDPKSNVIKIKTKSEQNIKKLAPKIKIVAE